MAKVNIYFLLLSQRLAFEAKRHKLFLQEFMQVEEGVI